MQIYKQNIPISCDKRMLLSQRNWNIICFAQVIDNQWFIGKGMSPNKYGNGDSFANHDSI